MRPRLHLFVAVSVLFAPAAGQAGPKAAPVKKTAAAPKTLTTPRARAREKAQKTVDAKKSIFNGRACICQDERFRSAVGEISLRVSQSDDGQAFASAVCWLRTADIKTGDTDMEPCVDHQALELNP